MRRRRVPNIVPPLVLSATFVGVVPVCALVSCGSSPTNQDVKIGYDVAEIGFGPDAVAICCFGVADVTFGDVIEEPTDAADETDEGGRDN
jgi:hypothetical protein